MNMTKKKHDAIQKEIELYKKAQEKINVSPKAIDVFVNQLIKAGMTDLNDISNKLKINKIKLVRNLTACLFSIDGDNILSRNS